MPRCLIHGSFRKHFAEIRRTMRVFKDAGIEVLAPSAEEIVAFSAIGGSASGGDGGFALFEGEQGMDPRMVELLYLHHLKRLGEGGFSYFVNPEGYIGKSASYELGIAQATNVPVFFMAKLDDHPAYFHRNAVWSPENLATFIAEHGRLPAPSVHPDEREIHRLWEELMVPGSIVAAGGIIEYDGRDAKKEKEILLVRTHKWKDRWSVVGGKVRRNERLADALKREVLEETGLRARVGAHLTTFDQIKDSGYYKATQHIFADYVVGVDSKKVVLNEEAQEHVWVPAREALSSLDIEPNARHIVALYAARTA